MDVAYLALFISIFNLTLVLWDRFPRAHVAIEAEELVEHGEFGPEKRDERLWITISNRSAKQIQITNIYAEWVQYRFFPLRYKKVELGDLQHWEAVEKPAPISRFWVEPWGNEALSADADEFQYQFERKLIASKDKISYRVIIIDGRQKKYKSNRITLRDPNLKLFRALKLDRWS